VLYSKRSPGEQSYTREILVPHVAAPHAGYALRLIADGFGVCESLGLS